MKTFVSIRTFCLIFTLATFRLVGQEITVNPNFFCDPSHTINISATEAWTNTGISLNINESVIILVKGIVQYGPEIYHYATPAGISEIAGNTFVVPGLKKCCVIGKIGENGIPFPIGEEISFTTNISGELYLGFNDSDWWDNSGSFLGFVISGLPALSNSDLKNANIDLNCYPNPFSDELNIAFNLRKPDFLSIRILDLNGKEMREIYEGKLVNGNVELTWNGKDNNDDKVLPGMNILEFKNSNEEIFQKIIIAR